MGTDHDKISLTVAELVSIDHRPAERPQGAEDRNLKKMSWQEW